MKWYIDLETNRFVTGPGVRTSPRLPEFKRNDAAEVELVFCRGAVEVELEAGVELIWEVKKSGEYGDDPLIRAENMTLAGGVYSGDPAFDLAAINAEFASEEETLAAMMEVSWKEPSAAGWKSSNTLGLTIHNDVIREGEELPELLLGGVPGVAASVEILFDDSVQVTQQTGFIDIDGWRLNFHFTDGTGSPAAGELLSWTNGLGGTGWIEILRSIRDVVNTGAVVEESPDFTVSAIGAHPTVSASVRDNDDPGGGNYGTDDIHLILTAETGGEAGNAITYEVGDSMGLEDESGTLSGGVNPRALVLGDLVPTYEPETALTAAQKEQALVNMGVGHLARDFYDSFQRTVTTGSMGTADSGHSYYLTGNGVADVKSGDGRYYGTNNSGAVYAVTPEPGYVMCGGRVGWSEITSAGFFGQVALILSPEQDINNADTMIHALYNKAGITVDAVDSGGVAAMLGGTKRVYEETGAYLGVGDVIEVGICIVGETLTIRDSRLPGGFLTVNDAKIAAVAAAGPLYAMWEVFNEATGLRGEFLSVWGSSNPNFISKEGSEMLGRASEDGTLTKFPGYMTLDNRNRGYQFPGHVLAHAGLDRVPTEYIDFLDVGDSGLSSAGGDINAEFPVSTLTADGLFLETDDEMVFEVWGQCVDPEAGDQIAWRIGATEHIVFTPPDLGASNVNVGFYFRWIIKRLDFSGTARFGIVASGTCGDEAKSAASLEYNLTGKPNIEMTGDCWLLYSARAIRKR